MMGAAMMLPLILASGPVAGYVLGRFVAIRYLGLPQTMLPVLIGLGFLASAVQVIRLIKQIRESDVPPKKRADQPPAETK